MKVLCFFILTIYPDLLLTLLLFIKQITVMLCKQYQCGLTGFISLKTDDCVWVFNC